MTGPNVGATPGPPRRGRGRWSGSPGPPRGLPATVWIADRSPSSRNLRRPRSGRYPVAAMRWSAATSVGLRSQPEPDAFRPAPPRPAPGRSRPGTPPRPGPSQLAPAGPRAVRARKTRVALGQVAEQPRLVGVEPGATPEPRPASGSRRRLSSGRAGASGRRSRRPAGFRIGDLDVGPGLVQQGRGLEGGLTAAGDDDALGGEGGQVGVGWLCVQTWRAARPTAWAGTRSARLPATTTWRAGTVSPLEFDIEAPGRGDTGHGAVLRPGRGPSGTTGRRRQTCPVAPAARSPA